MFWESSSFSILGLYRYLSGNLGLAKLDAVLSPFYRVRLGPDFDSAFPESLVTDE